MTRKTSAQFDRPRAEAAPVFGSAEYPALTNSGSIASGKGGVRVSF